MVKYWFSLSEDRRKEIFNQTAQKAGLPASSIEKDWWVTMVLKTVFELDFSDQFVFKGGTSLSKGWGLINRFSEDVDLAINMTFLGFDGEPTLQKITRLRKASYVFTSGRLKEALNQKLIEDGFIDFELKATVEPNTSVDPHSLELVYKSLTEKSEYISPMVRLEVGARFQMEPSEPREIQTFVGNYFNDQKFADAPTLINTVIPKRTFLEKAFLLHEEFQKTPDKMRSDRMSRHLYDLEKIMDTDHGHEALKDTDLYNSIINHRKTFTNIQGVDYGTHHPDKIDFVPPASIMQDYEKDYKGMRENMIYRESLTFNELIKRMIVLRNRFRALNKKPILARIGIRVSQLFQNVIKFFRN
jgi:hypothetical protein